MRIIAASVRVQSAVLHGEIVCLDADGRPNFYNLLSGDRSPQSYWRRSVTESTRFSGGGPIRVPVSIWPSLTIPRR